ncbi:MAG TPA: hypothetical protein VK501_23890 [Baekduia sp.]|uniref:hypothetical protein n=1 Tax=Baekduia sp. TaxID=2600305 RepID=UPI002C79EA14|nr:hypothetical protein [Baekduia sp.]HMJ36969.1 hypothetical protein [Baekduia sp.]
MIADSWRTRSENIIPFLALPADLRKAVYTTIHDYTELFHNTGADTARGICSPQPSSKTYT